MATLASLLFRPSAETNVAGNEDFCTVLPGLLDHVCTRLANCDIETDMYYIRTDHLMTAIIW